MWFVLHKPRFSESSFQWEIQQNFFLNSGLLTLNFSQWVSCQAGWEQTGWLRETAQMMKCIISFLMDAKGLFEGLGGILKAWLWLHSLCPRQWNTISVQMFKVFGRSGASSPLPLIWVGNALAGTVCFLCVCGLNCRFTYISDNPPLPPPLLLSPHFFPCPRSFRMVSLRKDNSQSHTVP